MQGIKNRDAEYARLDQLKKIGTDKFRKDLVAYLEDQLAAKHLLKTASDELGIEMDI